MVQQVTAGIKVIVATHFEGVLKTDLKEGYAFSYTITIENQSNDTVQLTSRYWKIQDALKDIEIVQGDGVIGVQPIIKPGHSHSYSSGCFLNSPIGAMSGHYNMVKVATLEEIKVGIPIFKLNTPFVLN